jgi:hypothetical protein
MAWCFITYYYYYYYYSVGATVHDESRPLFYSFLIIQTVGSTPWAGDQTAAT